MWFDVKPVDHGLSRYCFSSEVHTMNIKVFYLRLQKIYYQNEYHHVDICSVVRMFSWLRLQSLPVHQVQ